MAEKYSFRSSMNGFNRSDVITYIEKLMSEKMELAKRIESLEADISALNSEIAELKTESDTLRTIIVDENEKAESVDRCEECNVSKVYEARLGAAMLDAKRFSEVLIKEANDKVSCLFAEADKDASNTAAKTESIIKEISSVNEQMNASFSQLLKNLNHISDSVASFSSELRLKENEYKYTTDFTDEKETAVAEETDTSVKSEKKIVPAKHVVNFDDADEYEIKVDV